MEELIKITVDSDGKQAVSARELHSFLGSKRDFSNWIKDRIKKYGLVAGQDYEEIYFDYTGNPLTVRLTFFGESENQRVARIEYALSVDAAKELSMVEGNERGRMARRYFIEVDKKYRSLQSRIPQTYAEALRLAASQAEEIEAQKRQLEVQAPKALFADAVAASSQSCLVGEMAKILRQNGIEMGQQRFFRWLRDSGYLCKRGERYNQPTQYAMEQGLMELKKTSISRPDGSILVTTTPKITGKGQVYFVGLFMKSVSMLDKDCAI